jgi:hypothetical protein
VKLLANKDSLKNPEKLEDLLKKIKTLKNPQSIGSSMSDVNDLLK